MSFCILRFRRVTSHLNGAVDRENSIVRLGFHDHTILRSYPDTFPQTKRPPASKVAFFQLRDLDSNQERRIQSPLFYR